MESLEATTTRLLAPMLLGLRVQPTRMLFLIEQVLELPLEDIPLEVMEDIPKTQLLMLNRPLLEDIPKTQLLMLNRPLSMELLPILKEAMAMKEGK